MKTLNDWLQSKGQKLKKENVCFPVFWRNWISWDCWIGIKYFSNLFKPQLEEGKLNRENFVAVAAVILSDDAEKMKFAVELADECMHVKEVDRCEQAFKTGECIRIGGIVKNVDFGF